MNVAIKPYLMASDTGKMCVFDFHQNDQKFYSAAMSAPKQMPISFEAAMTLCWERYDEICDTIDSRAGAIFLQDICWATYLSSEGYHIEFRGNEFEFISEMAA